MSIVQLGSAAVALFIAVVVFGPYGYSAGPWPTRLAWAWLPTGATAANCIAAWVADRAAANRQSAAAARRYRLYLVVCAANLGAILAALVVVAHWPSYIIVAPWSPPVNDRLFVFESELYVEGPAWLLVVNPALFLLAIRSLPVAWRL